MKGRRAARAGLAALAAAGLIGAACSTGGDAAQSGSGGVVSRDGGQLAPGAIGGVGGPAIPSPAPAGQGEFKGAPAVQSIPGLAARIVKTASVSLTVRRGTFQDRVQQATLVAQRHGGFVESSQTTEGRTAPARSP